MSKYLFAYGTLQPGCVPASTAEVAVKLRVIGPGSLPGKLYNLGAYPGAIPDVNSAGKIYGTVLELPDDPHLLAQLDDYEGYDPQSPETSEYIRELQQVELLAGGSIECWFYRYQWKPDERCLMVDGRWLP